VPSIRGAGFGHAVLASVILSVTHTAPGMEAPQPFDTVFVFTIRRAEKSFTGSK
jgi:hypothetical protein